MKKIKNVLLLASVSALVFMACKKSSDDAAVSIVGKWKKVNDVNWDTYIGTTTKDTVVAHPDEYADFRTDGKIYGYYWDGPDTGGSYQRDTALYTVKGTELYLDYGQGGIDTLQIQTLTAHQLTTYSKYLYSNGTEESWSNFSR